MAAVHLERSSYTISINHKQAVSDSQSQYDELFISVLLEMCNKYNKFPPPKKYSASQTLLRKQIN